MSNIFWRWHGLETVANIITLQHKLVEERMRGDGQDRILLCEHIPCFTYTRAPFWKSLRTPSYEAWKKLDIPAIFTRRGGGATFHGPGQITAYIIIELSDHALNVPSLGRMFESIAQHTLARFGIKTTPTAQYPLLAKNPSARGAWVDGKRKIMQRGLRIQRGRRGYAVTQFGFALNVSVNLFYYAAIYPCGLDIEMTSMEKELGHTVAIKDVLPCLIDAIAYEFFPYELREINTSHMHM